MQPFVLPRIDFPLPNRALTPAPSSCPPEQLARGVVVCEIPQLPFPPKEEATKVLAPPEFCSASETAHSVPGRQRAPAKSPWHQTCQLALQCKNLVSHLATLGLVTSGAVLAVAFPFIPLPAYFLFSPTPSLLLSNDHKLKQWKGGWFQKFISLP